MTIDVQEVRSKARPLSESQLRLLEQVRRATDGDTPLQRSGEVTVGGLCARGSTIASLARRGLVDCGGVCAEVDGDGFTTADDVPWYAITAEGRDVLAAAGDAQRSATP